MKHPNVAVGGAMVAALVFLPSCEVNRACERARLHVADAYESLKAAAQERKLAGIQPDTWTFIETKVELLQSAFATRQVTWRSAVQARDDLKAKLGHATTDSEVSLDFFRRSADEAFKAQDQFANQCR